MKFLVHLLAFCEGEGMIREVDVPLNELSENKNDLDIIYHYGQNDFQPKPLPSVSMGDVICYGGLYFLIVFSGFSELSKKQFKKYCSWDLDSRRNYVLENFN